MIVVNKQRTSLINMDHISCVYMGAMAPSRQTMQQEMDVRSQDTIHQQRERWHWLC